MAILNDEAASAGAAVQSMMHAAPLFPGSDTDALSYFEGRNRSCSGPKIRRLLAAPKAHFFITFLFVTKDVWETIFAPAARNILYTRKKSKARGTLVDALLLSVCAGNSGFIYFVQLVGPRGGLLYTPY